ncbi:MAG TPA: SDR family NAD(P)-dependent oxidoreductase [Opitutaceae bacterium]|nr:SDR family NAD(P)-dependent oxidoreductase [Opitutaceae bacterium]
MNAVPASSVVDNLIRSACDGGPLTLPPDHPSSLAGALERAAHKHPGHGIFYVEGSGEARLQAYPQLLDEAARILSGLQARGLRPGQTVIFQLEHNHDFIPAFWACVLGGFVPVPVSIAPTYEQPHNILAKLRNAWSMLDGPPVLAGAALAPRLQAFAARENLPGFTVESVGQLRQAPPARAWHPARPDDLALLLLTSGSTGLPKAVRQTHRSLLAWAASVAQACEFDDRDVSINWMPLDHVGGLVMFHLRDVVAGCRQVHAPTEGVLQRPLVWLEWIERFRATITWAPNFAFGLVNEQAAELARRRFDLSSMRFILNGGEAIVSKTARRFLEVLAPHGLAPTAMRPAWGMSETSSGVTYSHGFTLGTTRDSDPFVEVGEAIPGVQIRIVDQQDEPVPEGKNGRLQVRGISITGGYHQNPEANQASFTADGWFITGDLGIIKDGRLSITGREKDVIIINGANFYSHEIESVVEEIDGVEVSFTAACAIRLPGENTDQVAVFFCPTPAGESQLPELIKIIRHTVSRKEGVTPDFIVPLAKSDIPKTAIGKIQRAQLKKQFEDGELAAALARGQTATTPTDVTASWFYRRVWRETEIPIGQPLPEGPWLVFADELGLGQALAGSLQAKGRACTLVVGGPAFAQLAPDKFAIDPHAPGDYDRVWTALSAGDRTPRQTVHLWSYGPESAPATATGFEQAQELGVHSLLCLVQAFARAQRDEEPHHLWVISNHAFAVQAGEKVAFEKSALSGLLKTLPQEISGLVCTQVDLAGTETADHAVCLGREFCDPEAPSEIACRDGGRFKAMLANAEAPEKAGDTGLVKGGCYLISGGVGGIGREIARYLAAEYQARLLIIGRSPAETVAARLHELQCPDRDVAYVSADIADLARVNAVISEAEIRWGRPLDGIFHLAGVLETRRLAEETRESLKRSLRPKTTGAWVLHQVVKDRPGVLVVNFSSLLGYFGGYQYGAYSAANAFLEGLSHYQRSIGLRSYCLMWSSWTNTGMNQGGAEEEAATRAKGYFSISHAQGMDSLRFALRANHPQLLIGLNGHNANIRPQLEAAWAEVSPGGTDYIEPRTETERQLAKIWQELLKRPQVGVRDNFFEIGGRSLLAARLFARIDKEMGCKLPLSTLFKAPTIETLAALLGESGKPAPPCQVLPVQPNGSRPPFFCIPGGGSDAIVFQDLSRALGPDQPFYGLQARGLDATPIEGEFPSVEQVAADFIKAIRHLQPQGPYFVGGHCFGCLLAWEVASQLKAQGHEVGLLALLDPIVSNVFSGEIIGRDRLRYHWQKFTRLSFGAKCGYFLEKVRNFSRTLVVRQRIAQSYDQARSMHSRYQLRPYPGQAVVFLANDSFFKLTPDRDPRRYYERLALEGTLYIEAEGDHHGMLHQPGVPGLAAELRACLARAATPAFA